MWAEAPDPEPGRDDDAVEVGVLPSVCGSVRRQNRHPDGRLSGVRDALPRPDQTPR
jgi:hypothetical protein